MQCGKKETVKKNAFLILCCMCFCCNFFYSCFSVPGEKDVGDRNLAAEYYDLAIKYSDINQYEKALSCLQKARDKADPADYIKIDYQMARTYTLSNKWNEAYELYEKLLEVDPDNTNLKEALAYITYKKGEKDKALQLYAELCECDPDNERIKKNHSEILNELNPPEETEIEKEPEVDQEAIGS
ncbi:MAG: tetratricopeptide repeat protein [Treponema sp.]|nr:tetratricopeptide repeat protein [Candidatus Treponema caballi]